MTLDLGTTSLAQVRLARGLTLEDAERSTRISRKFLIALEEHDYSVFPAPVYARGFLRTYCRYLGVDPEAQLAELPPGWTESTLPTTPMEPVSTRQPLAFNFAWLAVGALVVAVIGIALFLNRGGSGLDDLAQQGANQPEGQAPAGAVAGESTGSNTSQSPAVSPTQTSSNARRTLNPGLPGVLPDFENVDADEAMDFLDQQDIAYLRIDTTSRTVPAGLVVSQSPAAGSDTDDIDQVTLTVSSGTAPAQTNRTNCDVLSASNQRTAAEQTYFENNCADDEPAALPDRTSCEQIRGTDYRSPQERTFFLTYCIIQ